MVYDHSYKITLLDHILNQFIPVHTFTLILCDPFSYIFPSSLWIF